MHIYVGNLPYDTGGRELREAFESFGVVTDAHIVRDKHSNRSLRFGFVEMADQSEARAAIEALNGVQAQGRIIVVSRARGQSETSTGDRDEKNGVGSLPIDQTAEAFDDYESRNSRYGYFTRLLFRSMNWLRGDARGTPIWLCKVEAQPRVGTENEELYGSAVIYCFLQTQTRKAAIDDAGAIVDRQGWTVKSVVDCNQVNRSTVPFNLATYYKDARANRDSFVEFPEVTKCAKQQ
jgi:RNA recognition motif-containing protein